MSSCCPALFATPRPRSSAPERSSSSLVSRLWPAARHGWPPICPQQRPACRAVVAYVPVTVTQCSSPHEGISPAGAVGVSPSPRRGLQAPDRRSHLPTQRSVANPRLPQGRLHLQTVWSGLWSPGWLAPCELPPEFLSERRHWPLEGRTRRDPEETGHSTWVAAGLISKGLHTRLLLGGPMVRHWICTAAGNLYSSYGRLQGFNR